MTTHYQDNLIFDIGMHIGQDTEFYLAKGFKVIAIEANPLLAEEASTRFSKYIESQQLKILNVGIDDQEGFFPFYVNDTLSEWGSFIKVIGERGNLFHEIQVNCVTLDRIIQEHGIPYYLKVDIEGKDLKAIQRLTSFSAKPKYVSVENGNGGLLECLYQLGYRYFKFINQANYDKWRCPDPAREGLYIDYKFPHGSSGLFGEETEGEWKSYELVKEEIDAYWNRPDLDATKHGWYDLHAKYDG
jgi:FkbM family methyltransferase